MQHPDSKYYIISPTGQGASSTHTYTAKCFHLLISVHTAITTAELHTVYTLVYLIVIQLTSLSRAPATTKDTVYPSIATLNGTVPDVIVTSPLLGPV